MPKKIIKQVRVDRIHLSEFIPEPNETNVSEIKWCIEKWHRAQGGEHKANNISGLRITSTIAVLVHDTLQISRALP